MIEQRNQQFQAWLLFYLCKNLKKIILMCLKVILQFLYTINEQINYRHLDLNRFAISNHKCFYKPIFQIEIKNYELKIEFVSCDWSFMQLNVQAVFFHTKLG